MAGCNYCVIENQNPEHASASPFNKHQNPSLPDIISSHRLIISVKIASHRRRESYEYGI